MRILQAVQDASHIAAETECARERYAFLGQVDRNLVGAEGDAGAGEGRVLQRELLTRAVPLGRGFPAAPRVPPG